MLGLGLTRILPPALRAPLIATATATRRALDDALDAEDLRAKRKAAPLRFGGQRIALFGFMQAPSGLGRGARLMELAFKQQGRVIESFDVAPALQRDKAGLARMRQRLQQFAPSDLVLHLNPPSFRDLVRRLERRLVLSCSVVGYWAWELERLPADWLRDARLCDALWGPSEFVASALGASLPDFRGDIRVVPHPVELDPLPLTSPAARQAARAKLELAQSAFVAGYAFTMASNFARKNPLAAIEAFQRAFPREADVALLLRCPDSDAFAPGKAALARRAAGDNRIRLLGRGEAAIGDFYSALDVFVSLHRSEGYGLQIVEALQSGASVVATRWGLSDAIVAHPRCRGLASRLCAVDDPQRVYSSIEGARWAEPDIDEAAAELRALHADHSADNHDQ